MTEYILIGGAPLTGKSTLAKKLAKEFNCTWFATDSISTWMTNLVRKEDYEDLFYDLIDGSEPTAEEFYKLYSNPTDVFDGEMKKSVQVQKGITSLVDAECPYEIAIIEGLAITPEFVDEIKKTFPNTKFTAIFLHDSNQERTKQRLYSRGLYDLPQKYEDWIKPLELVWVEMYNQYYKEEAKKLGYMMLSVDDVESFDVKSLLNL